jgi:tripeptide aminopeptidase
MKESALDRFLRYVKIDTQSDDNSETYPSTEKQWDLLNLLATELKEIGIKDAAANEFGYVIGTLPANLPADHPAYGKVPTIGFLAHVDTSPESPGKDVMPQIIENYQGGDLVLPADPGQVIKESENPGLKKCYGHTIVTTDGTTLLGADDKAGIASIMNSMEYLIENPEILHGDIKIGFTPDEEIGKGTANFDVKAFGAQYAYTIDGELPGELNDETFSADGALITVEGRDIHPGSAKNIMVNSLRAMADIIARTPRDMAPETTENYEPYIHPYILEGGVVKSTLKVLFRDFDSTGLIKLKEIMEKIISEVQPLHPKAKITMVVTEQYRNMKDELDKNPMVLECLWDAATKAGADPRWEPIRGGTDGSRLTEMGLPCPNIYGGGQNFHSRQEWLSVDSMYVTVETIKHLVQTWVEKSK